MITGFLEKPRLKLQINGGLCIMTRELFERCPDKGQLEDTIYVELAQNQKFYSFSSFNFLNNSLDIFHFIVFFLGTLTF